MILSVDSLLDRMRLKAQITKWRSATIAIGVLLLALLGTKTFKNEDKTDNIARIEIEGIIMEDHERETRLENIKNDDHIKAVIVYINSPGGTIVGGETLYLSLRDIASVKPVVAIMGSMAASGGYMAAIAADHILARSGTITGSIGVLLESFEVTELAKKIGVNMQTFKSGELKGSPSPLEKTTPAVEKMINESIKDGYSFFVDLVKERRPLPEKDVAQITDGRIFTGRQAVANKLVDGLGGEAEAVKWLQTEKKVDPALKVKEVELKEEKDFLEKVLSNVTASKAPYMAEVFGSGGMMSLWKPTLN
jgi:protease-4